MDVNGFVAQLLVADRRKLEHETSGVRILVLVTFSVSILLLGLTAILFGFDDLNTQLILFAILHIVMAPLAAYAALRMGIITQAALSLSIVVTLADIVQLIVRIVVVDLTPLSFIAFLFTIGYVLADFILVAFLYRLWVTDSAQNNTQVDSDLALLREAILRQESNTLRLAALFGGVTASITLVFALLFSGIGNENVVLFISSITHIILAPLAAFIAPISFATAAFFVILTILQTGLDILQIILRLVELSNDPLTSITLDNIFAITFILLAVALLLIDTIYFTAGLGYMYALVGMPATYVQPSTTTTTSKTLNTNTKVHQTRNHMISDDDEKSNSTFLSAMDVRQRTRQHDQKTK